eukprot:266694-Prymnesium_polylepis.1
MRGEGRAPCRAVPRVAAHPPCPRGGACVVRPKQVRGARRGSGPAGAARPAALEWRAAAVEAEPVLGLELDGAAEEGGGALGL